MELTGAVLIFVSCALFGFLEAATLALRVKKLTLCRNYIMRVGEEIRRTRKELPLILESQKNGVYIENGVWQKTAGLTPQDLDILSSYAKNLGTTDIQGQIKNTNVHIESINAQIEEANEKNKKCSRLYVSLGLLGGSFLAVLVI